MRTFLNKNKGFTLIELLVVIAIISLLASVVFRATQQARSKGRDAGRIQTMIQLRNAIELYNTSTGHYPSISGDDGAYISVWGPYNATDGNDLIPGLIPTYIKSFPQPRDPNDWAFQYYESNNGSDYMLEAYNFLENPLSTSSPFYDLQTAANSPVIYSKKSVVADSGWVW